MKKDRNDSYVHYVEYLDKWQILYDRCRYSLYIDLPEDFVKKIHDEQVDTLHAHVCNGDMTIIRTDIKKYPKSLSGSRYFLFDCDKPIEWSNINLQYSSLTIDARKGDQIVDSIQPKINEEASKEPMHILCRDDEWRFIMIRISGGSIGLIRDHWL